MSDGVLNVTHPMKGKINYFCLYRSMRNQLEYNTGAWIEVNLLNSQLINIYQSTLFLLLI